MSNLLFKKTIGSNKWNNYYPSGGSVVLLSGGESLSNG